MAERYRTRKPTGAGANLTHVLIVSTEFPPGPGGIGTHAFQLATGLSDRGWTITVITRQDYVNENERLEFNRHQSFEVISVPRIESTVRDAWKRLWLLSKVLRNNLIDLVVCTGAQSTWLTNHLRSPVVAIGHGSEFGETGWRGLLTRLSFNRVDLAICVSNYTAEYMASRRIRPKRVAVIHNGADSSIFAELPDSENSAQRCRMGFSEADKLLLTVGNVTERKGQEIVIRALPQILSQLPNVHYVIAGLPTLQNTLTDLARDIGVSDHVHFLGRVDSGELNAIYNICDLFIMTSRSTDDGDFEGYGIAVIEAALCGKTAVVSDNSGLCEAVIDGVTGIVVPQSDPSATAEAVISVLTNPELQETLARNALETAAKYATWDRRIDEYDTLFREFLAQ